MKVVGLDLSLASTGVAWKHDLMEHPRVARVQSSADDGTIAGRSSRLRRIVSSVWRIAHDAELVVVEAPLLADAGGKSFDRAGLWWLTVGRLTGAGVPVASVSPGTLKVYGTSKGGTGKDEVLATVVRRYTDVNVQGNDEADALLLCCMGLRHLGEPYDRLTDNYTRAMTAVVWPTIPKGAGA